MNRQEIEAQVLQDYATFAGKLAIVRGLTYFLNNHSYDMSISEGALVRVEKGQSAGSIIIWNDDYCDPVWSVEAIDVPNLPDGVSSCWVHGISYMLGEGKTKEKHPELFKAQAPNVLYKPYTTDDMLSIKDESGFVTGVVSMGLDEIAKDNYEAFLDTLSLKLTGTDILMDIGYRVVGHKGNDVLIEVTGNASEILFTDDGEIGQEA